VQIKTLKAWEDKNDFKEMLLNDKEIRKYLSDDDINECFDYGYFIRNIDYIYSRVYKKDEPI
jgi:adenylosuccinate lyase